MKNLLIASLVFASFSAFATPDCGLSVSNEVFCVGDEIQTTVGSGIVTRIFDIEDEYDKVEFEDIDGQKRIVWLTTSTKIIKR